MQPTRNPKKTPTGTQGTGETCLNDLLPILHWIDVYIELEEEPPPVSSSRVAVNGYLNETFCRISIWKC